MHARVEKQSRARRAGPDAGDGCLRGHQQRLVAEEGDDDHGHRADDDGQPLRRTPRRRSIRCGATPTAASAATTITKSKPVGILAEKWEAIDPTHLALYAAQGPEAARRRAGPYVGRRRAHAQAHPHRSRKRASLIRRHGRRRSCRSTTHTFDIKTKAPAVNLVMALFDRFIITSRRPLREARPRRPTRSSRSAGVPTSSSSTRPTAAW